MPDVLTKAYPMILLLAHFKLVTQSLEVGINCSSYSKKHSGHNSFRKQKLTITVSWAHLAIRVSGSKIGQHNLHWAQISIAVSGSPAGHPNFREYKLAHTQSQRTFLAISVTGNKLAIPSCSMISHPRLRGHCSRHSRRGLVQEYKRTVFAYTHGLFIT